MIQLSTDLLLLVTRVAVILTVIYYFDADNMFSDNNISLLRTIPFRC